MASFTACFVAGLVTLARGTEFVYIGSGGCDGQDTHCKPNPEEFKKIAIATIDGKAGSPTEGSITVHDKIEANGVAAWLVASKTSSAICLFGTLADVDELVSYRIGDDGSLAEADRFKSSRGKAPVHASVVSGYLAVAWYHGPDDTCEDSGAGVGLYAIGEDCTFMETDFVPHTHGSQVIKNRQCASHVHSTTTGQVDGASFVYACDLGADRIVTYRISPEGKLVEASRTPTPPGSGPRHTAQHPTLPILYMVSEMSSELFTYEIKPTGILSLMQEQTALAERDPKGYGSKAAEIVATTESVYVSNRAFNDSYANSVIVFSIRDGGAVDRQTDVAFPLNGLAYPRGMALAGTQHQLLIGLSESFGTAYSFKIDSDNLELKSSSKVLASASTLEVVDIGPAATRSAGSALAATIPARSVEAMTIVFVAAIGAAMVSFVLLYHKRGSSQRQVEYLLLA